MILARIASSHISYLIISNHRLEGAGCVVPASVQADVSCSYSRLRGGHIWGGRHSWTAGDSFLAVECTFREVRYNGKTDVALCIM